MKTIIFSIGLAVLVSACNNSNNNEHASHKDSGSADINTPANNVTSDQPVSTENVIAAYLQLKNALAADNSKEAATAGKQLIEAMQTLGKASFTPEQKKIYDEIKEDVNEHAQHISDNASHITHQREHFVMLSKDVYDLVKQVKPSQTLYKAHCPMYNDKKGAIWLSETKEIRNPYYGKEMLTCGSVQEEIKQ